MVVSELFAVLNIKVDQSAFARADNAIKKLAGGFLKIAAIGSGVGVMLQQLTAGVADHAREIERTAKITGMGTEALQGLGYAAKISGISAEELQHGLIHLARSAREATMGGGSAGLAYSQLGIRVATASGKLRPLNEIFSEVAGKLQKMPDGTQKAAIAMALFGRAGAQLIPLLDQGPEGIRKFTDEARKLGVIMDEKTLAAGNRYRVTLDRMHGAIEGLKNSIAARLFPALTQAAEAMTKWIVAHKKWIALKVEQGFKIVSQVLSGIVTLGERVFHLFERIWKSGKTGKTSLSLLGAVVTALKAPWTSLAAVLALVAEDIAGYFEGRDSVAGRLLGWLEYLQKKLDKFGFANVFTEALAEAKKFFTFLDGELARKLGGNGSGFTAADKDSMWEQFKDWLRSFVFEADNSVRIAKGGSPLDPRGDPANFFGGRPAFSHFPGGKFAYVPLDVVDGKYYEVDAKTGAGRGFGPAFAPVFNLQIHATPGTDGGKIAQDFRKQVLPIVRAEHDRVLREAAAASHPDPGRGK